MEGLSSHSAAPGRSRISQSPSPSYSASACSCSSVHKLKLPPSDDLHAPFACLPFSFDGLTSNEDLDSIGARGVDSDSDSEDPAADNEDNDCMRVFTIARLDSSNASSRNLKPPKSENSYGKIDNSGDSNAGKDGRGTASSGSISGILVKGDPVKIIFAENIQTSGAYSAREESLKREEDAVRLRFLCLANDEIDEHMVWLIGLKNIFHRQLPNMPREYVVRHIMDRNHKSMMVIRHNQVVGGLTYCPYISQRFGELHFVLSLLMNRSKAMDKIDESFETTCS